MGRGFHLLVDFFWLSALPSSSESSSNNDWVLRDIQSSRERHTRHTSAILMGTELASATTQKSPRRLALATGAREWTLLRPRRRAVLAMVALTLAFGAVVAQRLWPVCRANGGTTFEHFAHAALPTSFPAGRVGAVMPAGSSRLVADALLATTVRGDEPAAGVGSPYGQLELLTFRNANTKESVRLRLYGHDGQLDETAAMALDALLADTRDPKQRRETRISRRLLQIVFRAAYHLNAFEVLVTSAYRAAGRHREGFHATGCAIDFSLVGVKAAMLASYLRQQPRVGVGIYTHPRTQFVHLDVRDQSYHWLDASPPGRTWRGMPLRNAAQRVRDASYTRADDWPEGLTPPALVTKE